MELSLPPVREAVKAKEWRAAKRDGWQRRTIMLGSFEVPERRTLTTAIFSEQNSTRFVAHRSPHNATEMTTGKSTLYAIDNGSSEADHCPTNHSWLKSAP